MTKKERIAELERRVAQLEARQARPLVDKNTLLDYILKPDTGPALPFTDARATLLYCPGCSPNDVPQPHICGIQNSSAGNPNYVRTIITTGTHS